MPRAKKVGHQMAADKPTCAGDEDLSRLLQPALLQSKTRGSQFHRMRKRRVAEVAHFPVFVNLSPVCPPEQGILIDSMFATTRTWI